MDIYILRISSESHYIHHNSFLRQLNIQDVSPLKVNDPPFDRSPSSRDKTDIAGISTRYNDVAQSLNPVFVLSP